MLIEQSINLDEGLSVIQRAADHGANDSYVIGSLGWAYFKFGVYGKAIENLERAIELAPEDSAIRDHLGDVYWKMGREAYAKTQWSMARDLQPDPDIRREIEKKMKAGLK
jgi:Flp pilus assembly protein TadD